MARARTQPQTVLQWAILLLVLVPAMAQALSSDRRQQITIEADRATLNEKDGSSIYEGNVHLQQGTLNLRGNRMTVQMSDGEVETIVLTGEPASYQQRPDDRDSDQHAEAGRIEYHAAEQRMILLKNARVWQSDSEDFRSERIVYNMKNNTVSAGGNTGDRVRITLQPKNRPEEKPADEAAPDATGTIAPAGEPADDSAWVTTPANPPASDTTGTVAPATPPAPDTTETRAPASEPKDDSAWVTTPAEPPETDPVGTAAPAAPPATDPAGTGP